MTPHMRLERIPTRMLVPQPPTPLPLTSIRLLPHAHMLIVDMNHQLIHIAAIPPRAADPLAHGDLLVRRLVIRHVRVGGRIRDVAGRVAAHVVVVVHQRREIGGGGERGAGGGELGPF